MRAYFVYYEPTTKDHSPRLIAVIPTAVGPCVFIKQFVDGTTAEWEDGTWQQVTVDADISIARDRLLAAVTAGGRPAREWSVDMPDEVFREPMVGASAVSVDSNLVLWFESIVAQFDATSKEIGNPIPKMSVDLQRDHLRRRADEIVANSLGAILLRTASVGQRDVPKVAPIEGAAHYLRPNGRKYYTRKWGEHSDVEVARRAREENAPIFLKSLPGTGKTAMFEAAYGDDMYTLVGNANTEEMHFLGTYTAKPDGTFDWIDGPLVRACKEGKVFYVDEVGMIDPRVLPILYPLMDGRGYIEVETNPEVGRVDAQPGFFIVGATNPRAPGARMSEALLSRFDIQATMTTDYVLAEKVLGINANLCRAAANLARQQEQGDLSWSPQFRELEAFQKAERIFGTAFALNNLLATVPEQDLPEIEQALGAAFGGRATAARIV